MEIKEVLPHSGAQWERSTLSIHAAADLKRLLEASYNKLKKIAHTNGSMKKQTQHEGDGFIGNRPATSLSGAKPQTRTRVLPNGPFAVREGRMASPLPASFQLHTPSVLERDEELARFFPKSQLEGKAVRTFGNNVDEEGVAVICEFARRRKADSERRLRERPPSYFKVSEEWGKRKQVDINQINQPPTRRLLRVHRDHSHHYSSPPVQMLREEYVKFHQTNQQQQHSRPNATTPSPNMVEGGGEFGSTFCAHRHQYHGHHREVQRMINEASAVGSAITSQHELQRRRRCCKHHHNNNNNTKHQPHQQQSVEKGEEKDDDDADDKNSNSKNKRKQQQQQDQHGHHVKVRHHRLVHEHRTASCLTK